jgi:hypothetical protein
MRKEKPDFYLSTAGEYGPLADPRTCWAGIRLRDNVRDDYMEIEIDSSANWSRVRLGSQRH